MKFGLFYMAEYANMMIVAAVAATFFLGGHYLLPFGLQRYVPESWGLLARPNAIWLIGKMAAILFTFIWVRGTIPRYRYDQLMHVGWKWLIPVSLTNLALAALIRYIA